VLGICGWLLHNNKKYFRIALISLSGFAFFHVYAKLEMMRQKKIIVYNIPGRQAIDFIYRNEYCFRGDSSLIADAVLRNFHLKPARAALQANVSKAGLPRLSGENNKWQFFRKKMIIIDSSGSFIPIEDKITIDILLISKNPSLKIAGLITALKPSVIVFDASNSLWKIAGWKKECERLALPCFSIPQEGAFILDIE
jgi:competence protein ComEC